MTTEGIYEAELLVREKISESGGTQNIYQLNLKKPDGFPKLQPGSSIAVYPRNSEALVDKLLKFTNFDGEQEVTVGEITTSLKEALTAHLELSRLTRATLQNYLKFINIDYLREMQDNPEQINILLEGKDITDFLHETPISDLTVEMLLQLLEPLKARYFFVSKHEEKEDLIQIVVTEKTFRYEGRHKKGICSTYLLDETTIGDTIRIAPSSQIQFSLPEDHSSDIIMIGAESGISPFRSFLHHRQLSGSQGKNWLLFSAQNEETDFIYRGEIESALDRGELHKLDTIYKEEKSLSIFVQDKVREHKTEILDWIKSGAHVYICADTNHKVTIVHNALAQSIADIKEYKFEDAESFLFKLEEKGQYQRITF